MCFFSLIIRESYFYGASFTRHTHLRVICGLHVFWACVHAWPSLFIALITFPHRQKHTGQKHTHIRTLHRRNPRSQVTQSQSDGRMRHNQLTLGSAHAKNDKHTINYGIFTGVQRFRRNLLCFSRLPRRYQHRRVNTAEPVFPASFQRLSTLLEQLFPH